MVPEQDGPMVYEHCFALTGLEFCHVIYREVDRPEWVKKLLNANSTTNSFLLS